MSRLDLLLLRLPRLLLDMRLSGLTKLLLAGEGSLGNGHAEARLHLGTVGCCCCGVGLWPKRLLLGMWLLALLLGLVMLGHHSRGGVL